MRFRNDMVSELVDLLDEATMIYYEDHQREKETLYYFESLTKVLELLNQQNEINISDKKKAEVFALILKSLDSSSYNIEEKRKALLLLEIKALKHLNYPLDIITPDTIGVICASLIEALTHDFDSLNIIDPNYGLGNLALVIDAIIKKPSKWFGIENHEMFFPYLKAKTNYMMNDFKLYYQDALKFDETKIDLVVADLAVYNYDSDESITELTKAGVTYFPYLLIDKFLDCGHDSTKYLYLIDNDFFKQKHSQLFQQVIEDKGQIAVIVMLPQDLFINPDKAKSIMIITKKIDKRETCLFMLPSLNDDEAILSTMKEIKTYLRSI